MSKDIYIECHEALIGEFMEANPDADYTEAYEKTADQIQARYADRLGGMIDAVRDRAKYGNL